MSERCPTCGRPYATGRLTKQQARILAFAKAYIAEHGFAPTYQEIADHMGYSSLATVSEHIANLRRGGHLQPAPVNVARAILPLTNTEE